MRLAVGSDEAAPVTTAVVEYLRAKGHEVTLVGALAEGDDERWPSVGRRVGELVAGERCDEGIVFCYTGTGVSIAANKVAGIRAALCWDAQTAAGAKRWNHANVLAMSLRSTTEDEAREILDAWFETPGGDGEDAEMVAMLNAADRRS